MIPSTNGSPAGRKERSAFIRSVFVQSTPDDVKTGEEVVKLLENVSSADWDQTAMNIVDLLASSNIALYVTLKRIYPGNFTHVCV